MKVFTKKTTYTPLTKILKDQEPNTGVNRIFATILVALSGILLILDKVFSLLGIEGSNTFGYSSYANFIWTLTQSIAPLLIIIVILLKLKPYLLACAIPVYCYLLQLVWVFSSLHSDDPLIYIYALGVFFLFCTLFVIIKLVLIGINKNRSYAKQIFEVNVRLMAFIEDNKPLN